MSATEPRTVQNDLDGRGTAAQTRPNGSSRFSPVEILSERFSSVTPAGGRGDVLYYTARSSDAQSSDADVLIRVISDRNSSDTRLPLFTAETSASSRLSHPGIVQTSTCQEYQNLWFAIGRYQSHTTLKGLLESSGWLDIDRSLDIAYQLASALEYAHSQGVLHLRIDPENILINENGSVQLGDFGIESSDELKWAHRERSRHCFVHYISPEQACDEAVDQRTDLYQLGVVLYQMLTDRFPFDSENRDQIRNRIIRGTALPPHLYRSEISSDMSAALMQLLAKHPGNRFPDAHSFRAVLDDFLGSSIDLVRDFEADLTRDLTHDETPRIEKPETDDEPESRERESFEADDEPRSRERESFESPTITPLNEYIEPPQLDSSLDFEQDKEWSEPNVPGFVNHGLSLTASYSQWRPAILVVALVIAAATMFIWISVHSRKIVRESDSEKPPATANQQAEPAASSASNPQPALVPTSAESVGDATRTAPNSGSAKPSNSSTSREAKASTGRNRPARKKWKRPRSYGRDYYRYPSRLY